MGTEHSFYHKTFWIQVAHLWIAWCIRVYSVKKRFPFPQQVNITVKKMRIYPVLIPSPPRMRKCSFATFYWAPFYLRPYPGGRGDFTGAWFRRNSPNRQLHYFFVGEFLSRATAIVVPHNLGGKSKSASPHFETQSSNNSTCCVGNIMGIKSQHRPLATTAKQ